jgi:catechol-2,3-dioxygenase
LWFAAVFAAAQEPKLNPSRVSIAIKTKDLARATAFYRDTIGLKVLISNSLTSVWIAAV